MIKLIELARSVCECPDAQIRPNQPLREVPGWDSMRAVNFQMELESAYGVDLSDALITGSSSLDQIVEVLHTKGVSTI